MRRRVEHSVAQHDFTQHSRLRVLLEARGFAHGATRGHFLRSPLMRSGQSSVFGKLDTQLTVHLSQQTLDELARIATVFRMTTGEYVRTIIEGTVYGVSAAIDRSSAKAVPSASVGKDAE